MRVYNASYVGQCLGAEGHLFGRGKKIQVRKRYIEFKVSFKSIFLGFFLN